MYREHILDAAELVFAENGYDAAKVQAVAAASGVSLATLYGVFETKWDLYRAVHERRTKMLHEYVRERGEAKGDALDRMLEGIFAYVEFHMVNPTYLRMHLRDKHVWSSTSTLTSPEQIGAWERGLVMMTKAFTLGQETGLYHKDETPELMARSTLAMHQVRLADWVERGMTDSTAAILDKVRLQFIRAYCTQRVVRERLGEDA